METIQLQSIGKSELESIVMRCMATVLRNQQPVAKETQPSGYITRKQVCGILHISMPTVHAWMKQGKLQSYHIGGRTLFKESEVMEAVEAVSYSVTASK
jgi:excisionase family DNA binding protein